MRRFKLALALGGILFVSLFAVLVTASPAQASPVAAVPTKIKIVNFAFNPSSVTVPVGSVVAWKNTTTTTSHTSTSDTGVWDSGTISPGGLFKFKFKTAGTFTYHCNIHPTMTGTIIVQ